MVKAGVCETVLAQLAEGKAEVKVFDGGQPEVDRQTIERAATVAREYAPDVVIGLGGGSNLDLVLSWWNICRGEDIVFNQNARARCL